MYTVAELHTEQNDEPYTVNKMPRKRWSFDTVADNNLGVSFTRLNNRCVYFK